MSTKICLDCMYYINTKVSDLDQAEAVASILHTTNVGETVVSSAILMNGLKCSLEEVNEVLSNYPDIPQCYEYVKKIGCEDLCKVCKFSATYTQENLELEEQLLHICIKDHSQLEKLINFMSKSMPENSSPESYADKLFRAEYMLSCQNADDIVMIQLHKMIFLSLLKTPDIEDNVVEYIQTSMDELVSSLNCDEIMQKKYHGEIARIANLELDANTNNVVEIAKTLFEPTPTNLAFSSSAETTSTNPPVNSNDMVEDVDFVNWSFDEKQDADSSPDNIPENDKCEKIKTSDTGNTISETSSNEPMQESKNESKSKVDDTALEKFCKVDEISEPDECVSEYLNKNGFLYNRIVMPKDAQYTYVITSRDELTLKYAIMLDFDVAVEPATWSENGKQGLLLYFFQDKYYYFLPFENMRETAYYALRGLFTESYHTVYTMISIPLFYRLFTLGLEEINVISLYDMYTVANGEPCEEPYNIIRTVTTEFEKNAQTYLPYTMKFYKSIVKKYMHRCDKKHKQEIARISYQNHTISMSYSLKKVCNIQETYLSFSKGDCSYACQNIEEFHLEGKKLHISYQNPVDNTSRYQNAFLRVLQKLYTCKVYKDCRYYVLDLQDDYLELYVSEKSREMFLSMLHHLLIKAGQRYISDVPHVEIIF